MQKKAYCKNNNMFYLNYQNYRYICIKYNKHIVNNTINLYNNINI